MRDRIVRGAAASLLCVGLVAMGAASAQETRSQQTQDEYSSSSSSTPPNQSTTTSSSKHAAMMKDCMERERSGDSTMSESEARKACHDALRAERDNQDNEPQPPHQH